MIASFFKISWRSIIRDKWFSAINIIGLAISMSVGLLMISLLHDLTSYDRLHEHADRTYRVITTRQHGQSQPREYASSSLRAGRQIKETISGIDQLTILEGGFHGDVHKEQSVISIDGFWADEFFFNVFTFPLIEGEAATALKEPYSIVLTETAANKLYQEKKAIGESVVIDGLTYRVTGVAKDVPMFSHLRFDALVSLATKEIQERDNEEWASWTRISGNYIYMTVSETADLETFQASLDRLCDRENLNPDVPKITLALQPLKNIVYGKNLGNAIGPVIPAMVIWIMAGLSSIVILCACFNYTSLSIARSLKRAREIGIRKVNGAKKTEIFFQFITEAFVISFFSFALSFLLFLLLRPHVLSLSPHLKNIISLSVTPSLVFYFIMLTITIGALGGFLPALLYTRASTVPGLKNLPSIKSFPHVNLRKSLVVIQYTFSLLFIAVTLTGYNQYKHFVSFDVGFTTDQIVNIDLQGKNPELLVAELKKIPGVLKVSRSTSIISPDFYSRTLAKYNTDSTEVDYNVIDENYLSLHGFRLMAGSNFSSGSASNSVIVNEQFLKYFQSDTKTPFTVPGTIVSVNGKDYEIAGVVKDFYYGGAEKMIGPYLFIYSGKADGFVSAKVLPASGTVWTQLETAWHVIDPIHPMKAVYYSDQLIEGYNDIATLLKIIGLLSVLTISIASLGLMGIVVFATGSRIKEIGIRKVFGSSITELIYLLSKEFLLLLAPPVLLALPIVFIIFERIILPMYAYHTPVSFIELGTSVMILLCIAFLVIGIQTWKTAHSNPVHALRNE